MAHVRLEPCPHCHAPLSYLEGVAGSKMDAAYPRCHKGVTVTRTTFLMADHSRLGSVPKTPHARQRQRCGGYLV